MENFWHTFRKLAFQRTESTQVKEQHSSGNCSTEQVSVCCSSRVSYVETILNEPCTAPAIYLTALTHRSTVHDNPGHESRESNQRLEFLGDAVLDLIVSEYLYTLFPDSDEGHLSSNRAKIVNRKSLAGFASAIQLGQQLIIGESADKRKIRESESALADAFEAFVGAVYLDKGIEKVRMFIMNHVIALVDVQKLATIEHNYKSRLIEYTQAGHLPAPHYKVIREDGAEHEKTFTIQVSVDGRILGTGRAPRKKDAEQAAACTALRTLKNPEETS